MSAQGGIERKQLTPDQLIIDGTPHDIQAERKQRYYEIKVGSDRFPVLLQPRLFYLFATLAIQRDIAPGMSYDNDQQRGFVHQQRLGLTKSLMNQYVYCTRIAIRQQANLALIREEITQERFDSLVRWPIFESGYKIGLWHYWRCIISPDAVFLSDRVSQFPNANLVKLAAEFYVRRGLTAESAVLS